MKNELIQQINDLNGEIADRRLKVRALKDKLAKIVCPFSIGQVIVNNNGVRAKIEDIRGAGYGLDGYTMVIRKIKNNGDLYKATNDVPNYMARPWKVE